MSQAHAAAAYDKLLKTEIQAAIDDPRLNVEHDEVMRRANERIAAIKLRQSDNV
jgi:hypothetical protein